MAGDEIAASVEWNEFPRRHSIFSHLGAVTSRGNCSPKPRVTIGQRPIVTLSPAFTWVSITAGFTSFSQSTATPLTMVHQYRRHYPTILNVGLSYLFDERKNPSKQWLCSSSLIKSDNKNSKRSKSSISQQLAALSTISTYNAYVHTRMQAGTRERVLWQATWQILCKCLRVQMHACGQWFNYQAPVYTHCWLWTIAVIKPQAGADKKLPLTEEVFSKISLTH